MPRLTILMPAFNAAFYITEAIESLLNQTFRDFELWIIDDASADETLSIVKSFQDPRIKILTNEANQGRVRTINKLVKEIQTPFFTVTDADDVSHPERLEKQIQRLENDPQLMMCGTSYWAMDERGFLIRELKLLQEVGQLRANALKQSQFLGSSTVMRKEVIGAFPHFYREYFIANYADADLSCLILDSYVSTNLTEPLYFYRILKSSVTRKKVTVRNLNLHRLIGFLSTQRRQHGSDCLQRNNSEEADSFINKIQCEYDLDASLFFRHQAFFHLYWGLTDLAFLNSWKALRARPFFYKNWMTIAYIALKIGYFLFNKTLKKEHYSKRIVASRRTTLL
jgi:glycosyltransferase involved in cell wall biosynthesis